MTQPCTMIPPAALPTSTQDQINWIRLARSRRVGPSTFIRLLCEHQAVERALAALPNVAKWAGVKGYEPCAYATAERELDTGLHMGYRPLFLGAPDYPSLLSEAPDAPAIIWSDGDVSLLKKPILAIVGARNASALGRRMAAKLAGDLGQMGYVIGSGLARGIDGAAHQATLQTGTIAVQAGGLDIVYPREHAQLTEELSQQGLRLSEQPPGLIPQARHFPQRNRIIAGLAKAVIVIEGAARSGSLITARIAADLGRDVMAVPGSPLDGRAAGCNMLIRDGATLIRSAEDVQEQTGAATPEPVQTEIPLSEQAMPQQPLRDAEIEERIASLLSVSEADEDDVIRDSGLPAPLVARQLSALELSGKIIRNAGGKLAWAS